MYVNKFNGIDEIRKKNSQTTESMDIDGDNNDDSSNIHKQEEIYDQDDIEVLFEIPPSSSDEDYGEFGDASTVAKKPIKPNKSTKSTRKSRHYEEIINILKVQYI